MNIRETELLRKVYNNKKVFYKRPDTCNREELQELSLLIGLTVDGYTGLIQTEEGYIFEMNSRGIKYIEELDRL